MSNHLAELNLWKALAQDPAWEDFVAPCSCYVDACRNNTDVPEKEIRPKLQFTTPGDYPILVCEYCGHDVIGETIEQCIAKHNAAMHEYDLSAWGESIWEGKPAYYPLTEQMVSFGFKMAIMDVNKDVWADAMKVFEAKGWTRKKRWCALEMGEECRHRPVKETRAKTLDEVLRPRVDLLETQAEKEEQETVDDVVAKVAGVMDEVIRTEPSNTAFDEIVAKTADRLGKTVEELHEAVQSKTNPSGLTDEELKPEKEVAATCREPTEKEVLFFGTAAAGKDTKRDDAAAQQATAKLRGIVGACMTTNKLTIAPAKQDVVVLYCEGIKLYKISSKTECDEVKILDLANKGYKGAFLKQQATSRKPQFTARLVDRAQDTLPEWFSEEDIKSGNESHFASICVVNKQPKGDDVLVWYMPIDLKPAMAAGSVPSWPSLAEIVSTTAEPPQKETENA
jgi:hypothetical protein